MAGLTLAQAAADSRRWRLTVWAVLATAAVDLVVRRLADGGGWSTTAPLVAGVFLYWMLVTHLHQHPFTRLGAANVITAGRLAMVATIAGGLWPLPSVALTWAFVVMAGLGAALDGVDGTLARRAGLQSRFGARFDMETDALLILVLSMLVWRLDKAGPWIVLAGALRYLFVAASSIWPWLAADLPESWRRKFTCVVQIATLIAAMSPIVPQPWSALLAGGGLVLLVWSFAVDVVWLSRQRHSLLA
jgi:phosphatidylglycerophosphate synthase